MEEGIASDVELELHHLRHHRRGDSTILSEVTTLRWWSKAFLISVPLVVSLFAIWHWQFMICGILLFLPSMRLIYWWSRNQALCPLDHVISSYAQGFYLLLLLGTGSGLITFMIASIVLFSFFDAADPMGVSGVIFVCIVEWLRWTVFVFMEELWKALFLRWAKLRRQHRVGGYTRAHAVSGIGLSLGYATAQSLLFMIIITAVLESNGSRSARANHEITSGEFGQMALWSIFFGVVSMPLNIMSTYLEGVYLARQPGDDLGGFCPCGFPPHGSEGCCAFLTILRWPVLLRSLFVSQFFIWAIVFGYVLDLWILGFIFVVVTAVGINVAAYCLVKRANSQEMDHDVYRSVYGFELLVEDMGEASGGVLDGSLSTGAENPIIGDKHSEVSMVPDDDDDLGIQHTATQGAFEIEAETATVMV